MAGRGNCLSGDAAGFGKKHRLSFMERFFKGEGRALVQREVERMKPQVIFFTKSLLTSSLPLSALGQG